MAAKSFAPVPVVKSTVVPKAKPVPVVKSTVVPKAKFPLKRKSTVNPEDKPIKRIKVVSTKTAQPKSNTATKRGGNISHDANKQDTNKSKGTNTKKIVPKAKPIAKKLSSVPKVPATNKKRPVTKPDLKGNMKENSATQSSSKPSSLIEPPPPPPQSHVPPKSTAVEKIHVSSSIKQSVVKGAKDGRRDGEAGKRNRSALFSYPTQDEFRFFRSTYVPIVDPFYSSREELLTSEFTKQQYLDWLSFLDLNYSLFLHGVGNKEKILHNFISTCLVGEDVLEISCGMDRLLPTCGSGRQLSWSTVIMNTLSTIANVILAKPLVVANDPTANHNNIRLGSRGSNLASSAPESIGALSVVLGDGVSLVQKTKAVAGSITHILRNWSVYINSLWCYDMI